MPPPCEDWSWRERPEQGQAPEGFHAVVGAPHARGQRAELVLLGTTGRCRTLLRQNERMPPDLEPAQGTSTHTQVSKDSPGSFNQPQCHDNPGPTLPLSSWLLSLPESSLVRSLDRLRLNLFHKDSMGLSAGVSGLENLTRRSHRPAVDYRSKLECNIVENHLGHPDPTNTWYFVNSFDQFFGSSFYQTQAPRRYQTQAPHVIQTCRFSSWFRTVLSSGPLGLMFRVEKNKNCRQLCIGLVPFS